MSSYPDDSEYDYGTDVDIVVEAVLRSKAERQQPPTREMFERLGAVSVADLLELSWIMWPDDHAEHVFYNVDDAEPAIALDTIAKLRAACLLLGIETEGVL